MSDIKCRLANAARLAGDSATARRFASELVDAHPEGSHFWSKATLTLVAMVADSQGYVRYTYVLRDFDIAPSTTHADTRTPDGAGRKEITDEELGEAIHAVNQILQSHEVENSVFLAAQLWRGNLLILQARRCNHVTANPKYHTCKHTCKPPHTHTHTVRRLP